MTGRSQLAEGGKRQRQPPSFIYISVKRERENREKEVFEREKVVVISEKVVFWWLLRLTNW